MAEPRGPSGVAGGIFGILVFLGGIATLFFTFRLANTLFTQDPNQLLGLGKDRELDLNNAAAVLGSVVIKVLLLLVMALVGGMVANRGIRLYADSRRPNDRIEPKSE